MLKSYFSYISTSRYSGHGMISKMTMYQLCMCEMSSESVKIMITSLKCTKLLTMKSFAGSPEPGSDGQLPP